MKIDKVDLELWQQENNVPSINLLKEKVKQFKYAMDWYHKSGSYIREIFGSESDLFIDLLAITSQRNSVKNNVICALHAFYSIRHNRPLIKKYGIADKWIKRNINMLLNNKDYSGFKITAFAEALKGNLDSIVLDVWMMKAFNINRQSPTERDRKYISYIIKKLSKKLHMKPAEIQACVWTYAKNELNNTNFGESYDFSYYLKDYNKRIKDNIIQVQTKLF